MFNYENEKIKIVKFPFIFSSRLSDPNDFIYKFSKKASIYCSTDIVGYLIQTSN